MTERHVGTRTARHDAPMHRVPHEYRCDYVCYFRLDVNLEVSDRRIDLSTILNNDITRFLFLFFFFLHFPSLFPFS